MRNSKTMMVNNPHPLLTWLTTHLFMGSTTVYPSPSCFICGEYVIPEEFVQYSDGHDVDGCTVVIDEPTQHGAYDSVESSVHMRMCDTKETCLKVTFKTSLKVEVVSANNSVVDICTTVDLENVSSLSIAEFKQAFINAVERHYGFIPGDSKPLRELVNRFIASM